MTSSNPSLRRIIKYATGQDITRCQGCLDCELYPADDQDIPLGSLIQLALMNDAEILQSKTLWSDSAIRLARGACHSGLDLSSIILALRDEAKRRSACSPTLKHGFNKLPF